MVEKAHTDVDEITLSHQDTKTKNVELEHEVSNLIIKTSRMKEHEQSLDNEVLEHKTKFDNVVKHNLLIDELNKEMMEMNFEDLCKFINQSLYECVHTIRRTNIKEIIKTGEKVIGTLKEQGLTDVSNQIETIMQNFEFLRVKKDEDQIQTGTHFYINNFR
jgi:hypothetical protein